MPKLLAWLRNVKVEKSCKTCRHYKERVSKSSIGVHVQGICVRRSPQAAIMGEERNRVVGVFPTVAETDVCSEWNRPTGSFWDM